MKSIDGIEPSATQRSAMPSAPFETPVARCTSGSTDAQAPQKSPSVTNASSVGNRLDVVTSVLVPAVGQLRLCPLGRREPLLPAGRPRPLRPDALPFGADRGSLVRTEPPDCNRRRQLVLVLPLGLACH